MSKKPTYEELEKRIKEIEKAEEERKQAENALRESEKKYRNIVEISLAGIYIIQAGIFKYVNKKFAEILGYSVEECLNNMSFEQTVHPEDLDVVRAQIKQRISGKFSTVNYTFRGIKKDGKIIHVEIFGSTIQLAGKPAVSGSILDITERTQVEERLAESEKRFRSLFEESKDAIVNTDIEGNLLLINPAGIELFGLTESEIESVNVRDFFVDSTMGRRLIRAIRDKGHIRDFGIQLYGKKRRVMDCLMTFVTKKTDDGALVGYEGIIHDISPYKKMEEELRRLATLDSLTGINNRRNFLDLAQKEITRASRYNHPFTLIMLDIDHFKKVNDTYGHLVGDQVLIECCNVCMKELRDNDIMGRLGGEEFAIGLMECDTAEAAIVAERIRQAVGSHTVIAANEKIRITVSLGVTDISEGCDLNRMLERADHALYQAKENGRNQTRTFKTKNVQHA